MIAMSDNQGNRIVLKRLHVVVVGALLLCAMVALPIAAATPPEPPEQPKNNKEKCTFNKEHGGLGGTWLGIGDNVGLCIILMTGSIAAVACDEVTGCHGIFTPCHVTAPPCPSQCGSGDATWLVHSYVSSAASASETFLGPPIDANVADCDGDGLLFDYDGHSEFAHGGAWILASEGDGLTEGASVCFGEPAHHSAYGPFVVNDMALGPASFTVAADVVNLIGPDPITGLDCGDMESDQGSECVGSCMVTFPPGRDGSYQVYVLGTLGTVTTG